MNLEQDFQRNALRLVIESANQEQLRELAFSFYEMWQATRELLQSGFAGLTMEAVAQYCATYKVTIHFMIDSAVICAPGFAKVVTLAQLRDMIYGFIGPLPEGFDDDDDDDDDNERVTT